MNSTTGGISEWDLDWLGVAVHNEMVYGVTEDTLVALNSAAEPEFIGTIRTGQINLNAPEEANVPRILFQMQASEDVTLTTYYYHFGTEASVAYSLGVRSYDGSDTGTIRRERLARGARAPWWGFELSGENWDLSQLWINVERLSREG